MRFDVEYRAGKTINTGNYESARIDIFVRAHDCEDLDQAYEQIKKSVEEKLHAEELQWQAS